MKNVRCNDEKVENCIVNTEYNYDLGDLIYVQGTAKNFDTARNPGEFDLKKYYRTINVYFKVTAKESYVIKKNSFIIYDYAQKCSDIMKKTLYSITDEVNASVFCAMLLGNKDEMDKDISDIFSACGIGHILAISGLHISIIGMPLYKILRRLGMNYLWAMITGSIIIIFYGIMTGNSVSTIRALIMFVTMVYANVVGRTYDMLSAVSFASVLMLVKQPFLVYNSGFILSYSAVAGVVICSKPFMLLKENPGKILSSVISSTSIQLATMPVIMYFYYEIPVLSILLNTVVVPLMSVVMMSMVVAVFLGMTDTFLGSMAIAPAVYIIKLYKMLCTFNMKIPWAVYVTGKPEIIQIILYYVLIISLYVLSGRWKKKYFIAFYMPVLCVLFARLNKGFYTCFLSVGQGDGIYIRTSGGDNILVDCGSSDNDSLYEYTLKPFLLSEKTVKLQYVIISHVDNDHISGIKELLDNDKIHVENFLMPSTTLVDEEYTALYELAQKKAGSVGLIDTGMSISLGTTTITCVHPDYNYECSDRNDYSTVLYVENEAFNMLLTGDVSEEQEKIVTKRLAGVEKINILKAAHHGSKFSNSKELLAGINPDSVVISCGKNNSYGHPHKEAVDRFENSGADIYRTDEEGAIIITMKNKKIEIEKFNNI